MSIEARGKKKVFQFGDFIAVANRAWGRRRAKGYVRLAVNAGLVVFQGRQRISISED